MQLAVIEHTLKTLILDEILTNTVATLPAWKNPRNIDDNIQICI